MDVIISVMLKNCLITHTVQINACNFTPLFTIIAIQLELPLYKKAPVHAGTQVTNKCRVISTGD